MMPMYDADVADPSVPWAVFSYALHAVLVGVHTLAFFKSVHRLGAVPTAFAKGATQAGSFAFAHLLFCQVDYHECIWWNGDVKGSDLGGWQLAWSHWQKSIAFVFCCAGVMCYLLGRSEEPPAASVTKRGAPPAAAPAAAPPRARGLLL